ncbi:hypothetical protein PINS_up005968 [Pythium insidiosum]|nr:hypothetical protein PINS_up005968 [Pythium insidiosum]
MPSPPPKTSLIGIPVHLSPDERIGIIHFFLSVSENGATSRGQISNAALPSRGGRPKADRDTIRARIRALSINDRSNIRAIAAGANTTLYMV